MRADDHAVAIFLKPGEVIVAPCPTVVTTLLGSCVAVTMFSPRLRLGAICHALLPSCRKETPCAECRGEAGRYVECALPLMLEKMALHGVTRGEIQAKLFGGSEMFDGEGKNRSVGRQNFEIALKVLEGESVRLVTQDLGGRRGRKIIFHTDTGEVFLKRLRKSEI